MKQIKFPVRFKSVWGFSFSFQTKRVMTNVTEMLEAQHTGQQMSQFSGFIKWATPTILLISSFPECHIEIF